MARGRSDSEDKPARKKGRADEHKPAAAGARRTGKARPAAPKARSEAKRPAAPRSGKATARPKPAARPATAPTQKSARPPVKAKPAVQAKPAAPAKPAAQAKPAAEARPAAPAKPVPKAKTAQPGRTAASRSARPAKPAPAARSPRAARPVAAASVPAAEAAPERFAPALTEEEQIESAKYMPRDLPARVFEEERFVFPQSYGISRIRLLVKDPQWIFAHWDVDAGVLAGLRSELGERAAALSQLTLTVSDPEHGGAAVIHLPEGSRSWYVRADRVRRTYRAELGLTLPWGEYRRLATSNTVQPPQAGPSPRRAGGRGRYAPPRKGHGPGGGEPLRAAASQRPASGPPAGGPGPWKPEPVPQPTPEGAAQKETGGASDRYHRGGASDVHRR